MLCMQYHPPSVLTMQGERASRIAGSGRRLVRDSRPSGMRFHSLDALRAAAMLLGLVLHAAIPYMKPIVPLWPVVDKSGSIFYNALFFCIHGVRMQAFFLIAGFFGC